MSNLHVSLSYQSKLCTFDLVAEQESNHTVKINGVSYALVAANPEQLALAKQILDSSSLDSLSSVMELGKRIKQLPDAKKVSVIFSTNEVATHILGTKKESHVWLENGKHLLPQKRKLLAEIFWDRKVKVQDEKTDHSTFKQFLGKEDAKIFDQALTDSNFELFASLFENFSNDDILNTYSAEGLGYPPLGVVKTEAYTITQEDLQNLRQYLDDIGFSGVVNVSDATSTYCVCPTHQENLEGIPFSMHSIGKVFTGTLALMTLPSTTFDDKLKLEESVVASLKEPVQKHLAQPTLHQAMTHNGGFGDYLANYEQAIQEALKKGEPPPVISKPEDFLKYADSTLHPLDKGHYSNLGILLVALHLQHHAKKPFDQLLQEHILGPADITISTTRPEQGRFKADDSCQGEVVGGPAGGYWIPPQDLHKLGAWLHQKCREKNSPLLAAMEKYGTEFYVPEDREIRHNGNSSSGSAMLSSFLDVRVTISVLSDQDNFMANKVYYTIRENLVDEP